MKKKKKKPSSGLPTALIVGVAAIGGVLLLGGGLSAFFVWRNADAKNADQQAKADDKDKGKGDEKSKFRFVPKIEDGNPATKKGGAGIVNNIRGSGYRLERQSELKQIGTSYIQFFDEYKGAARTYENFLEYIKTFSPIRDAVKDGYYQMNMNARLNGQSIICWERDMDNPGYLCVMGSGEVRYVPEAEWKTALGR